MNQTGIWSKNIKITTDFRLIDSNCTWFFIRSIHCRICYEIINKKPFNFMILLFRMKLKNGQRCLSDLQYLIATIESWMLNTKLMFDCLFQSTDGLYVDVRSRWRWAMMMNEMYKRVCYFVQLFFILFPNITIYQIWYWTDLPFNWLVRIPSYLLTKFNPSHLIHIIYIYIYIYL